VLVAASGILRRVNERISLQGRSLVCVYVLVAIVRKELDLQLSLSQLLQILSVNAFEQIPLPELVAQTQTRDDSLNVCNQLMLWN
jgi:hypothetical protein